MSKAILVIDMPQDCTQCPCASCPGYETIVWSGVKQEFVGVGILGSEIIRPDWCPLREAPSYKLATNPEGAEAVYILGWNEAIDTILGEDDV